jgi:Dolichyl-phosphate-mannose-protein mannosyltransferase
VIPIPALPKTKGNMPTPEEASYRAPVSISSASPFALDVEKISAYLLAIFISYAFVRNLFQAATKALWYDELCTLIISRQERISTIFNALRHGADGQPPLYYLAERFVAAFVANENIALRLPSVLGFSCVLFCLFELIREKRGNAIALFCASIPLLTVAYGTYATEARPYSLVLACISLALICYQRTPALRWTILLGVSLALAESFHYYAVLAFLPFIAGEMALLLFGRKFRWGVWLALASGLLPLAIFWPMLAMLRNLYSAHVWAKPTLETAESSYAYFFHTTFSHGVAFLIVATLAVLGKLLYQERRTAPGERSAGEMLQEPILILVFLSLPFLTFFAMAFAHGGMTQYYALPAVLGFPLAAAYALPRLEGRVLTLFSAFTILFLTQPLLPVETQFWSTHGFNARFYSPADPVVNFVSLAGHEDLPVAVSDVHDFMQLAHYASPEWRLRFVQLVDVPESIVYLGSDSGDKQLQILRTYYPLQIYDFEEFAAKHPVFLLYSSGGGGGNDWWPRKLKHDGYVMIPAVVKPKSERDYFHRVFLVSRGKDVGGNTEVEKASVPLRR